MAGKFQQFFVDIDLNGNKLFNTKIGANSNMGVGGAFQYNDSNNRLEYYNGSTLEEIANLSDIQAITGGLIFQGAYDPTTNTPDITDGTALKGYFWVCSTAGTFLGEAVQIGDSLIALVDSATTTLTDWLILQGNVVVATETTDGIVRLGTQQEVLDGTESGAVVVTPATLQGKIDSNSFATTLLVANWVADTDFYYQDVTHNLDSNWFNISAFDLASNMLCELSVNYTDANSLRVYVNEIPTDSIAIALSRVNPTM